MKLISRCWVDQKSLPRLGYPRYTPPQRWVRPRLQRAIRCQQAADILLLPPWSSTEELLSGPFNNWWCGHQLGNSSLVLLAVTHHQRLSSFNSKYWTPGGLVVHLLSRFHHVKIGCLYNGWWFIQTPPVTLPELHQGNLGNTLKLGLNIWLQICSLS